MLVPVPGAHETSTMVGHGVEALHLREAEVVHEADRAAVIDGEEAGVGKGPSKKAAEQEAAREALAKLESS